MRRFVVLIAGLCCCAVTRAGAQTALIRPGAIDAGISGALTVVEGTTTGSVALDGSWFLRALGGGLAVAAAELAYAHVNELDLLDATLIAGWTRRAGGTALYPYAAIAAGIRQEWIGSFADARYPVGFDVGARALVSPRADLRIGYRLRRVLGDPVEDFTEHEIRIGVGLLFRNAVTAAGR